MNDMLFGMIRYRLKEGAHKIREQDVTARMPAVDRLDEKAGRKSRFAASGRAYPDEILAFFYEIESVIQR